MNTFPSPSRIVLAGNSAGGFGTIFALPLVRNLYPGVPIEIINDSGVGVARAGEPDFVRKLIEEWNAEEFFPASCDNSCVGEDGHVTELVIWQLEEDQDVRLSMLSFTRDPVIANFLFQIGQNAFEEILPMEMQ